MFWQILAKLINPRVAAALFSSRRSKNLQNEKIFLHLEIAEIDIGGQQSVNPHFYVTLYYNGSPYICDSWVGYSAGGYSLSQRWLLT